MLGRNHRHKMRIAQEHLRGGRLALPSRGRCRRRSLGFRGLVERCAQSLRIPQPGGEESLNVAAAAAICLYESVRQRGVR